MGNPEKAGKGVEESVEQKEKPLLVSRIIVVFNDKVLIVQRNLLTHFHESMWSLPGGKNEKEETQEEAARRELLEETGLDLDVGNAVGSYTYGETGATVVFFLAKSSRSNVRLNEEHVNYTWVSRDSWENFDYTPDAKFILDKYFNDNEVTGVEKERK